MNKPVQKVSQPYWDYHEVIRYIKHRYTINDRKLWHWIVADGDINNGCFYNIDLNYWINEEDDDYISEEVREILKFIYDEFQEKEMNFWIEW